MELLKNIQKIPIFKDCRLVGGTSLALQLGHRKSIDLDFFGSITASPLEIQSELSQTGNLQIIQESKFIFQYIIDNVKVDFVNYPYPWLSDAILEDDIILADKTDIAAMKLSAITNRGTKKDFIDLYELLNHFTLSQILDFYSKKYSNGIPFMTIKSLTYFEDAESDPMPFMMNSVTWDKVKTKILHEVQSLSI
ncbi:MAG: nucleotidyl transferase AbiEii/AbiGii toxin family protein [Treponema sp.]|nr:nucleotidyl transferase AbiEii/AbiGii toxin family protein [Treponema sp.]